MPPKRAGKEVVAPKPPRGKKRSAVEADDGEQPGSSTRPQRKKAEPVRLADFLRDEDEMESDVDSDEEDNWVPRDSDEICMEIEDYLDAEASDEEDYGLHPVEEPAEEPTVLKSKDGKTEWKVDAPKQTKTAAHNKVTGPFGPLFEARNKDLTSSGLYKLFLTEEIVEEILLHTNKCGDYFFALKYPKRSGPKFKHIDAIELYAFIGLIVYFGLERQKSKPIKDLWTIDPRYLCVPALSAMSRNRFEEIRRFVRFDDKEARDKARVANQKIAKIKLIESVFDPFVRQCRRMFSPGASLCVDEMLVRYRGKSDFRVYMKDKPGKYGIKVWAIVDSTAYTCNLQIYEGKGEEPERNLGKRVVLDLCEDFYKSGRSITADNFFVSKSLAEELLAKNLTLLGTMNKRRVEVPPELVAPKKREVLSSKFVFHDKMTMVSYIPKKNRCVLLLSTQHHSVELPDQRHKKPIMILDYNHTKGHVDMADQMVGTYCCKRSTRRWPMTLFYLMLDIAGINSYVIKKHHVKEFGSRSKFLHEVVVELISPEIQRRANSAHTYKLPSAVKQAMETMGFPVPQHARDEKPPTDVLRGRCNICPGTAKQRRDARGKCFNCGRFFCYLHGKKIQACHECHLIPIQITEVPNVEKNADPTSEGYIDPDALALIADVDADADDQN